ncbi:MAG: hypothetical protein IAI49_01450 [Candidatus Eremiobacteraeota bacterium]|nr:hypothetical protein [Candidatus Eremiobacteraeota bacterium]
MGSDADELNPNPIVAMAMKIRARKDLGAAIDSATPEGPQSAGEDAAAALATFAAALAVGARRLNSILGKNALTFVRLEKPLRVRLRFADKRVSLDVDEPRQLVSVRGLDLDGEYQFAADGGPPALINLSKLSTDEGYGERLTPNVLLKAISQDAALPRPPHLDGLGPISL